MSLDMACLAETGFSSLFIFQNLFMVQNANLNVLVCFLPFLYKEAGGERSGRKEK